MSWLDTLENIRTKDFSNASRAAQDKAARDVVNMASYACAVVAVSPIPFSDAVLMLPVQSAMVVTVGHIYGRKLTQADAKDLVMELGATAGIALLARQGIKALLPVVGALLTVPAAFAANWAIGRVAMEYFRNPGMPKEQLKKVYESAKKEGSELFSRERFDAFRKSVMNKKPASEPAPEAEAPAPAPAKKTKAKAKAKPKKKAATKKAKSTAQVIEQDIAKRLRAHPEVADDFGGVLHLEVTGDDPGQWTVDFTKPGAPLRAGLLGKPKLSLQVSSEGLSGLLDGATDVDMAVLSGDLVITPLNLELAKKLAPLFA